MKRTPDRPVDSASELSATDALAILLSALQSMILPPQVWLLPYLNDGRESTEASTKVGTYDADSQSFDDLTRDATMPNQRTVVVYVHELLELVGQRAYAILAALSAGRLTPPFVPAPSVAGWRATSLRTKTLLLMAFVLEVVFGAKMAERLAGSSDYVSWAVGLAVGLVLTASSLAIAHAINSQAPGLLRGRGGWVALGVAVIAIAFLSLYSWGLGGGAQAEPSGGGLVGGTAPTDGSLVSMGQSENWALVLIYGALLLLLLSSVVLSHLIDLYREDVVRVEKDMATKASVLSSREQKLLAIDLLLQCLVLLDQAKRRGQGLVDAYVGGARSRLSPGLNSVWDTEELERLNLTDPAWVEDIKGEIERLRCETGQSGRDGDGPPLSLVPAS